MEAWNTEIYGDFAAVYDKFMDETPYEQWCLLLIRLIEAYGVSKPRQESDKKGTRESEEKRRLESERNLVVDLGCGTGTLTELLYQKGYDMIGIDNSPAMLNIAMEKREKSGAKILYLLQDMRELDLYSTVGTVVSVCDSLNYILEEKELGRVFSLVRNFLFPGGIFVFDFNTDYKYREVIGDATIAENREECSFIWENYYDSEEEINEYDLTVFVREEGSGQERYRRFCETHFQRGYRPAQIKGLAEQAGLCVLTMFDMDTGQEIREHSERICVVCRKEV